MFPGGGIRRQFHPLGQMGPQNDRGQFTRHFCPFERGVEVGRHRARRLTGRLVRAADLVLVTERRQVSDVERIEPTARGKVYALGNWENADVVDPHGLHEAAYRESLALIERLVKGWLSRIC